MFFIVHPSKYHVFRNSINILKAKGHICEIVITSKDVLEDLIINEGWDYTNIFPDGRKIKNIPVIISAIFNTFRTVLRLRKYIGENQYDLFITDDLLVFNGWYRNIPSLLLQDDDLSVVPETILLFLFATRILSPTVSDLGSFNYKKISFLGYKELGGLHPSRFKPDFSIVEEFNPSKKKYFIIRLVSLQATHDIGKSGLNDADVFKIIKKLEKTGGKVFISSERHLPKNFECYRINISPNKIAHALSFAEFIISDSQTMSAESAVLGTPYIRFNDFIDEISYLNDLEYNYNLGIGVRTSNKNKLFSTIDNFLELDDLKEIWLEKRNLMLNDKIDLTAFFVWLFEDYNNSLKCFDENNKVQNQFIKSYK